MHPSCKMPTQRWACNTDSMPRSKSSTAHGCIISRKPQNPPMIGCPGSIPSSRANASVGIFLMQCRWIPCWTIHHQRWLMSISKYCIAFAMLKHWATIGWIARRPKIGRRQRLSSGTMRRKCMKRERGSSGRSMKYPMQVYL